MINLFQRREMAGWALHYICAGFLPILSETGNILLWYPSHFLHMLSVFFDAPEEEFIQVTMLLAVWKGLGQAWWWFLGIMFTWVANMHKFLDEVIQVLQVTSYVGHAFSVLVEGWGFFHHLPTSPYCCIIRWQYNWGNLSQFNMGTMLFLIIYFLQFNW